MFIPIGQQATATIQGEALRTCTCEACRTEYVFFIESTAKGYGASLLFMDNDGARNRATSSAEKKLQKALEKDAVSVACPRCGWFQANMVAVNKKAEFIWACKLGLLLCVVLLLVTIYLGIVASKSATLVKYSSLFCLLGGPIVGIVLRIRHDPNAGHPGVGSICRERAENSFGMTRKDYDAMMRARQSQARNKPDA